MAQISRRDLLTAGLAGAAIAALPDLSRVLTYRRELFAQTRSLSVPELSTLTAICARLIPTDENGPGALEAGAANYIDRALSGWLVPSRQDYATGLAAIESKSQQKFNNAFTQLSAQQQDAVLGDVEDTPFFALVRGHTLQGTFGDPIYGGNANFVGWNLIGYPGVRMNVSAAEQNMSTPAARNHKSAYDYLMFSKPAM
jgi:gluconate 2-dehydrogenase gamma chain